MTPKPQESGMPLARAMQNNSDLACGDSGFINQGFESDKRVESSIVSGNLTLANVPAKTVAAAESAEPKPTDFDDLLPHLGEFGKYQIFLFLCMIPFAFFICFVYFSQIFITVAPEEHWCRVPELEGLPLMERVVLSIPRDGNGFNKCQMYDVNYTEILASGIKEPNPSWPTAPCKSGWEFNFTDIPYPTITTDFEWVCEHSTLPVIAQSIFFVGAIVGGLLFGWIADRFGRVPALVGCNFVGFAAGIATAFVTTFWEFALCRFLVGFAFDNCFTMMYILVLEYIGPKWRTFVANMSIAIFFTAASCALPWIAYYLADWKMFAIVTSAPLALVVLTPLIVPESARWLVSQGKIERAINILTKIERVNKKTIPPQIYKDFSDSCVQMQEEESSQKNYSVLDLFKTPRLRKITILLIVIWMAISLVFDGHVRNVGSLGLNIFVTFTVASATEFPADTFLTLTLDRWGRRWLAFGSMVMSGVFSLLATTVPVGPVFATLAILGRFSVNISYNIGLQYAAELLPTVVRAQGVAFIHIMGYVAAIVAPFVVHLANISPELPLIVLGIIGIFGGFLSLFLPETLGHELPLSLADGEEFGRGQKMWYFPCISKNAGPEDNVERGETLQRTPGRATLRGAYRGELQSNLLRRSKRADKTAT